MGLNEYRAEREQVQGYKNAADLAIYEGIVAMGTHLLDEDGRSFSADKLKDEKKRKEAADKFTQKVAEIAAKYFLSKLPEKDDEGKPKYDFRIQQLALMFAGISHQQILDPLNDKQDKFKLGEFATRLVAENQVLGYFENQYKSGARRFLSVSDAEKIVEEIGAKDKVDAKKVKDEADLAFLVDKYLDNGMVTPEDVKNKAWAKSGESN